MYYVEIEQSEASGSGSVKVQDAEDSEDSEDAEDSEDSEDSEDAEDSEDTEDTEDGEDGEDSEGASYEGVDAVAVDNPAISPWSSSGDSIVRAACSARRPSCTRRPRRTTGARRHGMQRPHRVGRRINRS